MPGVLRRFVYQRTLRWVNRQRARAGDPPLDELPLGLRGQKNSCPVASGVGHARLVYGLWHEDPAKGERSMRLLPPVVVLFIKWFDAGKYPELREPAALRKLTRRPAEAQGDRPRPSPATSAPSLEERIEAARNDEEFQARLSAALEENAEALERLA